MWNGNMLTNCIIILNIKRDVVILGEGRRITHTLPLVKTQNGFVFQPPTPEAL